MPRQTSSTYQITRKIYLNAGQTEYYSYNIPQGKVYSINSFYGGSSQDYYFELSLHNPDAFSEILNGGMETDGEVTAWPRQNGTVTIDRSGVQHYYGSYSMRMQYSQSAANAISVKQTFSTPHDWTNYRCVTAHFFNDLAAGGTRTLTVIISTTGNSSKTFVLSGPLGTAPFTANNWIKMLCDLENPTSSSGTSFDISQVTDITLKFSDSANLSGTIYWDSIRLEDSIEPLYSIFGNKNTTSPDVIVGSDIFIYGDKLYIISTNTGTARARSSCTVTGDLTNA